jgi:hypothetical protein
MYIPFVICMENIQGCAIVTPRPVARLAGGSDGASTSDETGEGYPDAFPAERLKGHAGVTKL